MGKPKVAIVVTIYLPNFDERERKSMIQGFKILKDYPFFFTCPQSLNTQAYSDICRENGVPANFVRYDDGYFKTIIDFNRMLMTREFYLPFKEYDFMLIYQMDAWVFRDELPEWCAKGIDYVGSPWFKGLDTAKPDAELLPRAGNGGFSLRHIPSFLRITRTYKILKSPGEVYQEYNNFNALQKFIRIPTMFMRFLGYKNNSIYYRKRYHLIDHEDIYWANIAPTVSSSFRVATGEEAIGFGWEFLPRRLYAMNNNKLPFGCHAWWTHDLDFWKQFIN